MGVSVFLHFYQLNQLPPGLFGDEALISLIARDAVASQTFPIYFELSSGGFHPAIGYLTILARWLTQDHILAVRYGVAAVGVLSTPVVYLALAAIFQLDEPSAATPSASTVSRPVALALLGTLIYTIAFPCLLIHRLGFEVMFPVITGALTMLALALALRTGQWRYYALTGLALGLGAYTYYSARFLPFAVVIILAWHAGQTRAWRQAGIALTLTTLAALIVFAPLGLYFLNHPALFFARAIATGESTFDAGWLDVILNLLEHGARTLAGLSLPGFGDILPRHNLPGRPAFDAFLSLLFWCGVMGLVARRGRLSSVMLGAWAAIQLLPVALTMTLNSPHFTRMAGAMPALAGIAAVGVVMVFERLSPPRRTLALALLTTGFVASLGLTLYDYFVRWANDARLFDAFQIGDWQAATLAQERAATQPVYVSSRLLSDYAHATFNLMLSGTAVRDFPSPHCLVYHSALAQPQTYIVDVLRDQETSAELRATFPGLRAEPAILSQENTWALYEIFQVPAGAVAMPPAQPRSITFVDGPELLGYSSEAALTPGAPFTLKLFWRAPTRLPADYTVFLHLYAAGDDPHQPPRSQSDSAPCQGRFPTTEWQAGDVVMDEHQLTLPGDFAADSARVVIGLYTWPSLERVPLTLTNDDESALALDDQRAQIGLFPVSGSP